MWLRSVVKPQLTCFTRFLSRALRRDTDGVCNVSQEKGEHMNIIALDSQRVQSIPITVTVPGKQKIVSVTVYGQFYYMYIRKDNGKFIKVSQ